ARIMNPAKARTIRSMVMGIPPFGLSIIILLFSYFSTPTPSAIDLVQHPVERGGKEVEVSRLRQAMISILEITDSYIASLKSFHDAFRGAPGNVGVLSPVQEMYRAVERDLVVELQVALAVLDEGAGDGRRFFVVLRLEVNHAVAFQALARRLVERAPHPVAGE